MGGGLSLPSQRRVLPDKRHVQQLGPEGVHPPPTPSTHETILTANTSNAKVDGAGGVPVSAMPALMTECVARQAFADMASIRTFHAGADIPADAVYFVQKGDVSLRISLGLEAKGRAHDADPLSGASDVVDLTSVPVGGMFNHERLIAVSNVSARAGKQGCTLIAMALDKLHRVASPTGQRCADALCELIFGPMAVVATLSYQQPHNCCSITALALALSTLGHTTEPTDIALMAGVSASYLTRAGLSLGELFNVANAYLHKADLLAPYASQQQQQQPARDDASAGVDDHTGSRAISGKLHCECYHFDASIVSYHAFCELLHNVYVWQHAAPAAASNGDVPTLMSSLVSNFHVRTAHGHVAGKEVGGGHFSLIVHYAPETDIVTIFDVHPAKYGRVWLTSSRRLFEAMCSRDGFRARGILRITPQHTGSSLRGGENSHHGGGFARGGGAAATAPLIGRCRPGNLLRGGASQATNAYLMNHLTADQSPSLGAFSGLAAAATLLSASEATINRIKQAAWQDFRPVSEHLMPLSELYRMANSLFPAGAQCANSDHDVLMVSIKSSAECTGASTHGGRVMAPAGMPTTTRLVSHQDQLSWLRQLLMRQCLPDKSCVLMRIDLNTVYGSDVISKQPSAVRWEVLAVRFDANTDVVTLIDLQPTVMSSVWEAPAERLLLGLLTSESGGSSASNAPAAASRRPLQISESVSDSAGLASLKEYGAGVGTPTDGAQLEKLSPEEITSLIDDSANQTFDTSAPATPGEMPRLLASFEVVVVRRQPRRQDRGSRASKDSSLLHMLQENHPLLLFSRTDDERSAATRSLLGNICAVDVTDISLDMRSDQSQLDVQAMWRDLIKETGQEMPPYLFIGGEWFGSSATIIEASVNGTLLERLEAAGLATQAEPPSPTIKKNVYNYPKGDFSKSDGKLYRKPNILVCACGSSAADKLPLLVASLVDDGYSVKVVVTKAAEVFFQDHGCANESV